MEIFEVDLSKGKVGKDFGKGFYLNPNYEQALKMADKAVRLYGDGKSIVNEFVFDSMAAERDGLHI